MGKKSSGESAPAKEPSRKFGVIKDSRSQRPKTASSTNGNKAKQVKVFQDSSEPNSAAGLEGNWGRKTVPNSIKQKGKENRTESTTWTEGIKVDVPKSTKPRLIIEARPEEFDEPELKEKPVTLKTKVLKDIKGAKACDQFWMIDSKDENESSNQKVMYRKKDVYMGIKECSFEEMKALKWLRQSEKNRVIRESVFNMTTPKQKPLDQFAIEKRTIFQPDFDDDFDRPTQKKALFEEFSDDLVLGVLPETPVNTRNRVLSDISEESAQKKEPLKKPKFQIFQDNSD